MLIIVIIIFSLQSEKLMKKRAKKTIVYYIFYYLLKFFLKFHQPIFLKIAKQVQPYLGASASESLSSSVYEYCMRIIDQVDRSKKNLLLLLLFVP